MSDLLSATIDSPVGKLYLLSRGETVLGLNHSGYRDLLSGLSQDELKEKIGKTTKVKGITDKLSD